MPWLTRCAMTAIGASTMRTMCATSLGRQIPFTERGGTEDKTSGLTADLNAKANRDSSMPIKREPSEAVYDAVPQDPCDKGVCFKVRAHLRSEAASCALSAVRCRHGHTWRA